MGSPSYSSPALRFSQARAPPQWTCDFVDHRLEERLRPRCGPALVVAATEFEFEIEESLQVELGIDQGSGFPEGTEGSTLPELTTIGTYFVIITGVRLQTGELNDAGIVVLEKRPHGLGPVDQGVGRDAVDDVEPGWGEAERAQTATLRAPGLPRIGPCVIGTVSARTVCRGEKRRSKMKAT